MGGGKNCYAFSTQSLGNTAVECRSWSNIDTDNNYPVAETKTTDICWVFA